jgi:hypothetical protein
MRRISNRGDRRLMTHPDADILIDLEIAVQDARREVDRAVEALRQRVRERDDLTRRYRNANAA